MKHFRKFRSEPSKKNFQEENKKISDNFCSMGRAYRFPEYKFSKSFFRPNRPKFCINSFLIIRVESHILLNLVFEGFSISGISTHFPYISTMHTFFHAELGICRHICMYYCLLTLLIK